MTDLEKFWSDMVEVTPKAEPEPEATILGVPVVEPATNCTNAELTEALERISALEKLIAEKENKEDGVYIESKSDSDGC